MLQSFIQPLSYSFPRCGGSRRQDGMKTVSEVEQVYIGKEGRGGGQGDKLDKTVCAADTGSATVDGGNLVGHVDLVK